SLNLPRLQHPFQGGAEHQPGVVDIVTDADPQHLPHLKPKTARRSPAGERGAPRIHQPILPQEGPSAKPNLTAKPPNLTVRLPPAQNLTSRPPRMTPPFAAARLSRYAGVSKEGTTP